MGTFGCRVFLKCLWYFLPREAAGKILIEACSQDQFAQNTLTRRALVDFLLFYQCRKLVGGGKKTKKKKKMESLVPLGGRTQGNKWGGGMTLALPLLQLEGWGHGDKQEDRRRPQCSPRKPIKVLKVQHKRCWGRMRVTRTSWCSLLRGDGWLEIGCLRISSHSWGLTGDPDICMGEGMQEPAKAQPRTKKGGRGGRQ